MKQVVNHITGERVCVTQPVEAAAAFLRKHPVEQFDTDLDTVIWFRLNLLQQMVALVAYTESICEAAWEGPGWYKTVLEREYESNWLRLEKSEPDKDLLSKQLQVEDGLDRLRSLDT